MSRRKLYFFDELAIGETCFLAGKNHQQARSVCNYWQRKLNWVFNFSEVRQHGVFGVLVRRVG